MKTKMLLTMTGALISTSVLATPSIYPKDLTFLSQITNNTNSNIVADDSDPRVIWVLPPNTAYSKVGGLHTITANVGFCKEMANIQSYSNSLSEKMLDLQKRELEAEREVDAMLKKISTARQELADYVVSNNLHDISQVDDRIMTVEAQISELTDKLESCQQNCSEVSSQLNELRNEKLKLTRQRREISKDKIRSVRIMDQKKAAIEGYEKDLEAHEARYTKLSSSLEDLRARFLKMYEQFAEMEGARASISFESDWEKNIQTLIDTNPGYDFKQIHTQNAVISTSLMAGNSLPGKSAVLAYELSGKYEKEQITYPSYPSSLSGNLRLSLIGTCPVLHPELFDINVPTGTDQMKYGMVISYEFPSSFEVDVTATYNMYKMYQKIVKSKKRGGFFSSSKKTSITEKNFFKDEFKVQWNEQDQANSLTEEQKADYEKEIRDNIFGRLAAIGLPTMPNPGNLVAEDAGPSGAAVLASSLQNNPACKANLYCTATAIGVNFLNAVFGSSSSVAKYTKIDDVELTERWSRKEVVYKPWISSYR